MTESRVQHVFLQAVQAYQQSGVVAGRHMHDTVRQIAAGSLYDRILTGLADAVEGRWEAALAAYTQALEMGTDSFKLVFALKSNALAKLARYDEAVATLDEGIALAPGNFSFYEMKAVLLVELHRFSEAIGVYDAILKKRPHSVEILLCKSLAFFLLDQAEQAWSVQHQVFSILPDPSKLPTFRDSVRAHLAQYDREVADILVRHETQADAWYWKGLIAFVGDALPGQMNVALDLFEQAISLVPTHGWGWNGKGMVLMAQGNYRDAAAAFAQAVSLLPSVEGVARNRRKAIRAVEGQVASRRAAPSHTTHSPGADQPHFSPLEIPPVELLERLIHEKRLDDALQVCEHLVSVARLSPGRINLEAALSFKARLLYDLHRTEEAIAIYREVLHRDPTETQARDELADILIEAQRFGEALNVLSVTTASQERDASLYERRAGVFLLQHRYQEAWEAAMCAHALDPGRLSISLVQIEALHHLGNSPKALRLCEETVQTAQRSARAFPLLLVSQAQLVLEAGRPSEALAIYEEALRREQEHRTRPIEDEAGVVLEGFGPFPGDVIAVIYSGMGNAWLCLGDAAKALACYDQALSFGPDDTCHKNRDQALALLLENSDRPGVHPPAEGIIEPSTPESAIPVERGWPHVPWTAVLTRLRVWLLRPGR